MIIGDNVKIFTNLHIYGDLIVEGNLTVGKDVTVNGTVISLHTNNIEFDNIKDAVKYCKSKGIKLLTVEKVEKVLTDESEKWRDLYFDLQDQISKLNIKIKE